MHKSQKAGNTRSNLLTSYLNVRRVPSAVRVDLRANAPDVSEEERNQPRHTRTHTARRTCERAGAGKALLCASFTKERKLSLNLCEKNIQVREGCGDQLTKYERKVRCCARHLLKACVGACVSKKIKIPNAASVTRIRTLQVTLKCVVNNRPTPRERCAAPKPSGPQTAR